MNGWGSMDVSEADAVSPGTLGERVRELRRRRGLTLEELAERSGVSRAMISKVERGEKNPTLVVAAKLAEGLGITLSEFAGTEKQREVVVVPREGGWSRATRRLDSSASFSPRASGGGESSSSVTSSPKGPRPASSPRIGGA